MIFFVAQVLPEIVKDIFGVKTVSQFMNAAPQTCCDSDSILLAAKMLRVADCSSLVVVDDSNAVVGIVTRSDLLDEYIRLIQKK
jgi:predicted transcriptional regulator